MSSTIIKADIACAIIAGGKASRFGGQVKAFIEVGDGATILARQLDVLRKRVPAIAIAANDHTPYQHTGLPVLPDRVLGKGPLAGLAAALTWCRRPYLLALACDMPNIDLALIDLLLSRRGPGVDVVVPYVGGRPEPLCALYARRILPVVDARLDRGELKLADLLLDPGVHVTRIHEAELRAIDPELRFLDNINTPEDLHDQTS